MKGRFPANLLVSDDVLNDGIERKSGKFKVDEKEQVFLTVNEGYHGKNRSQFTHIAPGTIRNIGDSGSYSKFFDLDAWYEEMFGTD